MPDPFSHLGLDHPAPHRDKVSMRSLLLAILGSPLLWLGHVTVSYFLAVNTTCGNQPVGEANMVITGAAARWLLLGLDALFLVLLTALTVMAVRNWRRSSGEYDKPHGFLMDVGEGRTSFMAHWGMLSSFGFLLAMVFVSIGLLFVPICPLG